jgi:hypothetical protein
VAFRVIPACGSTAKPLGTGCNPANPNAECIGVPIKEFRASVARPFLNDRLNLGVNLLIASGYTGQTTQSFSPQTVQEVVGVRIPDYASLSLTYSILRVPGALSAFPSWLAATLAPL